MTDLSQRTHALKIAVFAAAILLSYFFADVPLARLCEPFKYSRPHWLESFTQAAGQYGQAYVVIFTLAVILALEPKRRADAKRLLLAVALAAVTVHLVKMTAGRARPLEYFESGRMWRIFEGWRDNNYTAFPSAHTIAAFALTGALSAMYPRGRGVFLVAAGLCGLTRILTVQHYVSDVAVAAALGLWMGGGVYRWKWSVRLTGGESQRDSQLREP